jgi:DNA-binding MarR family transcriptional regulator
MAADDETIQSLMRSFKRVETLMHAGIMKKMQTRMTPGQMFVLMRLLNSKRNGTESMRVSEIAAQMGVTVPATTQLITGLEKEGFIKREMDPDDRRAVRVSLVPKGAEVMSPCVQYLRVLFGGLADFLGEGDTEKMIELLGKAERYFFEQGKV